MSREEFLVFRYFFSKRETFPLLSIYFCFTAVDGKFPLLRAFLFSVFERFIGETSKMFPFRRNDGIIRLATYTRTKILF